MEFFDLNVPILEEPATSAGLKEITKRARRVRVAKAMELGYSGIAYNKSIHGDLSDSDSCTVLLFSLSTLLKATPSLRHAAKFHRELLGVPVTSPFRQYTRLTVAVDSVVRAAALNAGNPVLKTYDLIAVQPLNQVTFDQACKICEVDLIAIDFSRKLPFRLKFPMVKAAIQRGIYFEITYSPLVSDVHARRQMLSGAKLLLDWTRGKNLILSSAVSTVNELRGPCDVANLLSLLGLSRKKAEAAVSRNCRSLIANALRKKQWYKRAIKVERISTNEFLDLEKPSCSICNIWDPISSGKGDLVLNEEKGDSVLNEEKGDPVLSEKKGVRTFSEEKRGLKGVALFSAKKEKWNSLLVSSFNMSSILTDVSSQPGLMSDELNKIQH